MSINVSELAVERKDEISDFLNACRGGGVKVRLLRRCQRRRAVAAIPFVTRKLLKQEVARREKRRSSTAVGQRPPTHVWHAKRMKMDGAVPVRSNRGVGRASFRASRSHGTAHDATSTHTLLDCSTLAAKSCTTLQGIMGETHHATLCSAVTSTTTTPRAITTTLHDPSWAPPLRGLPVASATWLLCPATTASAARIICAVPSHAAGLVTGAVPASAPLAPEATLWGFRSTPRGAVPRAAAILGLLFGRRAAAGAAGCGAGEAENALLVLPEGRRVHHAWSSGGLAWVLSASAPAASAAGGGGGAAGAVRPARPLRLWCRLARSMLVVGSQEWGDLALHHIGGAQGGPPGGALLGLLGCCCAGPIVDVQRHGTLASIAQRMGGEVGGVANWVSVTPEGPGGFAEGGFLCVEEGGGVAVVGLVVRSVFSLAQGMPVAVAAVVCRGAAGVVPAGLLYYSREGRMFPVRAAPLLCS